MLVKLIIDKRLCEVEKTININLYKKVEKLYSDILKKIDFTKVDKKTAKKFEQFHRDYTSKDKSKGNDIVPRRKLKSLLAVMLLSSITLKADAVKPVTTVPSKYIDSISFATQTGKNTVLTFYSDHVNIADSYRYDFDERMYVLNQVQDFAKNNDIEIKRSIRMLESEWYIHNVCYTLGIERSSTKDADLDFVSDARWFVNFATDIASLFYTFHDDLDNYQYNEQNIISQEDLLSYEI